MAANDTVVFARETMHLLAKFIATHSDNPIFRQIYEYAPDNLAWFWSFFDWDAQINFEQPRSKKDGVTLRDFKNALNRHNYKFFFKSMDDDFG